LSAKGLREKLLEIQNYWLSTAKSRAGESIKNILDILVELTYIEPGQFILEFLQNAEDALMEGRKRGYFRIELYKDKVIISNNGKPLDEHDLDSLCNIKSRKKPGLGYKGFIGIGWKSVYKVSDHVEIYSNGISFEFNKKYWASPLAQETLRKYDLRPEDVLWQVTPIEIKPTEAVPKDETKFIVHLRDTLDSNEISRMIDELGFSTFLFLDHVNRVEIVDNVRGRTKSIEWFPTSEEVVNGVRITRVVVTVTENESSAMHKFLVFRKEFTVPDEVRKDIVTITAKRSDIFKREVALAFYIHTGTTGEELRPLEEVKLWGMYSFLPLYEVRTGLKFLIQADFIVHPGRRFINSEAKWNHWLMASASELLKEAIRYLVKNYKRSYLSVFDYQTIGDEIWFKLIKPYIIATIDELLKDPPVVCINGHEVRLSSTVKLPDDLLNLVKYGLLSEEELKYIYGVDKHILDPSVKLRGKDSPPTLRLEDLLNPDIIRVKLNKDLKEAINYLNEIYKLAYERNIFVPYEKRFVITQSKDLKPSLAAYIPNLPEEIEELRKRFPEVENYLSSLDFLHEDFVNTVGLEILKWLGVKEVNLRELAEKVILKQISGDKPPSNTDDLLVATTLVKKSGITVNTPIWVLTRRGVVEKSNNTWYPLKAFEGLDVSELLGIEVLDIDRYAKYDPDIVGWKTFFTPLVKGLQLYDYKCYYPRCYCWVRDYVYDLLEKIKKLLEVVPADINIKLVRLIKAIYYDSLEKECRNQVKLLLLTDEDKLTYSDQLLFHDAYEPEEKWLRWKEEGFQVGPFVSPRYIENPSNKTEVGSWRQFFKEVLGVKEGVGSEIVERFAEWFAEKKLVSRGYRVLGRGEGCDFNLDVGGNVVCVEIKGRKSGLGELEVELTERETRKAIELRDNYWLIVVESIPNNPTAWLLKDPGKLISVVKFKGEHIKGQGELLDDH
jgi:hypothetical protein